MKRQRAKQRPLYRYDVYRGRRRGQARLIGAAGCAVFGLLLVLIRSLGIRFSGFLLLGLAALLVLSWLLDRLAAGNHRWRLIHRGFYGCLTVGLAALLGLEVFIINRGRRDMTPLPADAVIVLGAGVNGTEPSLSLRTRLDKAVDYLERWPDIPAVLTGGTGYGEEISEAQCMYDYLTEYGVEADRLILEDRASNTAELLWSSTFPPSTFSTIKRNSCRSSPGGTGQVGGAMALEHIHAFHDFQTVANVMAQRGVQIGRASCRERV